MNTRIKTNRNKQLRLDEATAARVSSLVAISGLSESDILRLALRAGLPLLESGQENPFDANSRGNTAARSDGVALVSESPATYRRKKTA